MLETIQMDLADASLVAAAEALNQKRIFTLDRDFDALTSRHIPTQFGGDLRFLRLQRVNQKIIYT